MDYTPEQRAEAVALAVEVGTTEAASRLEMPKSTLNGWLSDEDRAQMRARSAAKTSAATEEATRRWALVRAELVGEAGDCAKALLALIRDHVEELAPRNARDAKDLATAMAILVDKAQLLDGGATSRPALPWDPDAVKADAEARVVALRPVEDLTG